jgi:hypothetical protein
MPAAAGSPPPSGEQYQRAIEQYRGIVKWLLSIFGAVAGVALAGVQFTSIGDLHDWKLFWAVLSATVGFGAVVAILVFAVRVLSPTGGTYNDFAAGKHFDPLRKYLRNDRSPLRGRAHDAAGLANAYAQALTDETDAYQAALAQPTNKQLADEYQARRQERQVLFPVVSAVTALGILLRTRQLFQQFTRSLLVGVSIAGAGSLSFAYFVTAPVPASQSVDCAAYYLELDSLADDEPQLANFLKQPKGSAPADARAQACGFSTKAALSQFASELATH